MAVRTLTPGQRRDRCAVPAESPPSLFPGTPLADLFDDPPIHGLVERALILSLFGLLLAIGLAVRRVAHNGQ